MENEEKLKIVEALARSGNINIGQLSIGDHNTMNYFHDKKENQPVGGVTLDDVGNAIRQCRIYMYAQAALAVAFAVCRDVCNWEMGQSEFERKLEVMGIDCKKGTIANTLRNNPYMREHVDKWAAFGAKGDVLKYRDEFVKALKSQAEEVDAT